MVVFVKGTENDSDIFTKNVTGELHDKHVPNMMKKHEVFRSKETTN